MARLRRGDLTGPYDPCICFLCLRPNLLPPLFFLFLGTGLGEAEAAPGDEFELGDDVSEFSFVVADEGEVVDSVGLVLIDSLLHDCRIASRSILTRLSRGGLAIEGSGLAIMKMMLERQKQIYEE